MACNKLHRTTAIYADDTEYFLRNATYGGKGSSEALTTRRLLLSGLAYIEGSRQSSTSCASEGLGVWKTNSSLD